MIRSYSALALLLAISLVVVIGCSGGGSSTQPAAQAVTVVPNPSATSGGKAGSVTVSFQIARHGTDATHRRPQYLPSWTTAATVVISPGGSSTTITFSSNPGCTTTSTATTCTVTLTAPLGSDTFTITAQDTSGYIISAFTFTQTITNSANVVQATALPLPAQFLFSQVTPGQDGCPIVSNGAGQTSTFTYVTYDADYLTNASDSTALASSISLATQFPLWNDGGVTAFQLASTGTASITGATPSLPIAVGAGTVTATYNGGSTITTFTADGPDAFNYSSGALVTLDNRGSSFNITPVSNTSGYLGHYVFINNTGTSPHETDIWDICKRRITGADSILPAPASTPYIQGPVVLDANTSGGIRHFFQLYSNGTGGGQVAEYNYAYPAFNPTSQTVTPPLLTSASFIGYPEAVASSGGFIYVTTGTPGTPSIMQYSVTETGTSASLTSGALVTSGLTNPGGVAVSTTTSSVFVADTGANALITYPLTLGASTALVTTSSTPSLVPGPIYLAASSDGQWVAVAAPSQAQVSVIAASVPSVVATNLSLAGNAIAVSWTPPSSSGNCFTSSNSGVLAVLESNKIEYFGGFGSSGTFNSTGISTPCGTPGSVLTTNNWIDVSSIVMGAAFVSGTNSGGVNTNLQPGGTEAWRAINRTNGIKAWTRTVSTGTAATITTSR